MILLCCTCSQNSDVWNDLFVAGVGGAAAGGIIWFFSYCRTKYLEHRDKERVYKWLNENVNNSRQWFKSREVASYTNLTQERVRYIGSIDERVVLSTGFKPDLWGINGKSRNEVNVQRPGTKKKP